MGRPAKRVTSEDVARAAGVSRTTVSFVLNEKSAWSIPEETRNRVLDAARQLDYRPRASARALAAGRSDAVAAWTTRSVTGICAYNDEVAMAVLAGIRAHGRTVPGDMALVGAGDIQRGQGMVRHDEASSARSAPGIKS